MNGSTIGTIVGGIAAVIGAFFSGGSTLAVYIAALSAGAAVGGAIGGALDPPAAAKIQGPRLGDLSVQTATYGAVIRRIYGSMVVWGNMFWIENGGLKENETTETQGGKGPTQEVTTYTYSATFALGLCLGPIFAIKRVWIGPKLFYDIGSTDPDILYQSIVNSFYVTVYYGTEDQLPDPRMQATLGITNVPAYRGLAYLVFKDFPLADYGNSLALAQIKVEVVKDGNSEIVFKHISVIDTDDYPRDILLYKTFAITLNSYADNFQIFDIRDPYNPLLVSTTATGTRPYSMFVDGSNLHIMEFGNNHIITWSIEVPSSPIQIASFNPGAFPTAIIGDSLYMYIALGQAIKIFTPDGTQQAGFTTTVSITAEFPLTSTPDGNYLYILQHTVSGFETWDLTNKFDPVLIATTSTSAGGLAQRAIYKNGLLYIIVSNNKFQIFDVSNQESPILLSTTTTATTPKDIAIMDIGYAFVATGASLQVFNVTNPASPIFVDSISVPAPRQGYSHSLEVSGSYIYMTSYIIGFGALDIFYFFPGIISSNGIPLSEIVQAETLLSNLVTASDIDVTSLTPLVRGYQLTQVAAIRGGLDPLQASWPFDAIQSGYKIKYILRGSASSIETIDEDDLDARKAGEKPGIKITSSREMDSVLPKKVSIKYMDVGREYDQGEQYAERINTDAVNISDIELPIALTADEAAQKAQILLYMYWLDRYTISFNLPPIYSELEPTDVITIVSDTATYIVRLTSINYRADGILECTAKYHKTAVYTSFAIGDTGESTGGILVPTGDTIYQNMDIPLLEDTLDKPGFILAMTGVLSGWPGGVLYVTDDFGVTWTDLQSVIAPGAIGGYTTNALSINFGTTVDAASVLNVRLYNGSLSSVSEQQMFSGQNWFAYGIHGRWEIIAAQNVVLQFDGSYSFSQLLRSQLGTEWASDMHATGDLVIYLSTTSLKFVDLNSNLIGVSRNYRGITLNKTIDTDINKEFTYDAVNFKPLSPTSLSGNRHTTTRNWTLTWIRRSRYAGWHNYVDAPMGEVTESYEIEIWSGVTASAGQITVAWDPTDDPSVTGYYIHWATSSHAAGPYTAYTYHADVTGRFSSSYTITGLTAGTTYYINMSSHGAGGHDSYESSLLGEITKTADVLINEWLTPTQAEPIFNVLKRTLTATSQTVSYSSANQVTDFGSNQATLYVKIYQLSATVGRGYPLIGIISRA